MQGMERVRIIPKIPKLNCPVEGLGSATCRMQDCGMYLASLHLSCLINKAGMGAIATVTGRCED